MALDPSKWTHKTNEAVQNAMEIATGRSHPNLTPDHLLLALLGQADGLVLPLLQRAGEGCIVNLSSMFGLVGVPMQTSYCATKFAVRGFSESLSAELVDQNIDVVSVHPGGISTRIMHNSRSAGERAKRSRRKLEAFFERKAMPASDAAAKIVKGIKRGSTRVLITKETYATDAIKRLFPALPPKLVSRARKIMGVD